MKQKEIPMAAAVEVLPGGYKPSISQLVQAKIVELEAEGSDEAFFICDVGDVVNKFQKWKDLLPRVAPFYAVKCNTDETIVKTLAHLGTGFDCASKAEIAQILSYGVDKSRIIYANPCKQKSFVKYAAKHGVDLMTFDNEAELVKVKALYPNARMVLRILPTLQVTAQCELGNKFGCHPDNAMRLLMKAQELGVNVMGISFHVGSGVGEARAFSHAVKQAREVWDMAMDMGFDMTLLDVGGGFPGQDTAEISFDEIAVVLNTALDEYFPSESCVDIIAEPGRYFVASAYTLTCNIIAKRTVARDVVSCGMDMQIVGSPDGYHSQALSGNDEPSYMYYLNDGVYGSFNSLLYDHATVEPRVLKDSMYKFTASVWGPTCDGLDCILKEWKLPDLDVGSWMFFNDMGAYTMCAGSCFNGIPRPNCFYFISDDKQKVLMKDEADSIMCGEYASFLPCGAQFLLEQDPRSLCTNEGIVMA